MLRLLKGVLAPFLTPFLYNEKNGMLKTFDYVVANPPFSLKNWTDGLSIDYKSKQVINDRFNRFEDGTPPEKKWRFCFFAPHHQILKKHR